MSSQIPSKGLQLKNRRSIAKDVVLPCKILESNALRNSHFDTEFTVASSCRTHYGKKDQDHLMRISDNEVFMLHFSQSVDRLLSPLHHATMLLHVLGGNDRESDENQSTELNSGLLLHCKCS